MDDTGRTGTGVAGKARMVDIGGKEATAREAVAEGYVRLSHAAWTLLRTGEVPKGDVLGVARVAGIVAAKETPRLLPLCHPIPLSAVQVEFALPAKGLVRIEAQARTVAPTGVEMEALVAVAAAALCIYDMLKPVDRAIRLDGIRLLRKRGGKSGDYEAPGRKTPRRRRPARAAASARKSMEGPGGPKRSR